MNHSLMNYVLCMVLTVPLMTDCMLLSLAKRTLSSKVSQRGCFSIILPKPVARKNALCDRLICKNNCAIENEIWDATQYPDRERVCAVKIDHLLNEKIVEEIKEPCCHDINLHLAVLGNLPIIANKLLQNNADLVHVRDVNKALPIDLARDGKTNLMLKLYGSPEKSQYSYRRAIRVPGHGWINTNDIVKACMEGDLERVIKIAKRRPMNDKQKEQLRMVGLTSYWRYHDPVFLKIVCYLETGNLQKCC